MIFKRDMLMFELMFTCKTIHVINHVINYICVLVRPVNTKKIYDLVLVYG